MRIAVLAHALSSAGGLSVGRSLIDGIANIAPEHAYLFIVPEKLGYEEVCARFPHREVASVRVMNPVTRLFADLVRIPKIVTRYSPDVILALDSSMGQAKPRVPQAILLHAPHLVYPVSHYGPRSFKDRLRHTFLKRHFRRELQNTAVVFCQTNIMRDRLNDSYSYEGRVPVVGTAVPPTMMDAAEDTPAPPLLKRYSHRFKLFYPTRYYPHKNIEGLVELYARYGNELSGTVTFLTISEDQHPNVRTVLRKIEKLGLGGLLVNVGHIPYEEIAAYYRHADAMLMPSLLESYSTTFVEAFEARLPVLASDLDFARASCGQRATYFDPWNSESIRDAILSLATRKRQRPEGYGANSEEPFETRTWNDIAAQIVQELEQMTISEQPPRDSGLLDGN